MQFVRDFSLSRVSRDLLAIVWLLAFLAHPSAFAQQVIEKENSDTINPNAETMFRTLSPEQSGVDFVNPIDETHKLTPLYSSAYACGGVLVADFNGDRRPDLFLTGGPVPNALYLQDSKSSEVHFSRMMDTGTEAADSWAASAAAIDIDLDGDLDIYVANYDAPNQLFVNQGSDSQGKLHFTEEAKAYRLDFSGASYMPAFNDYDGDGDLDLFLLTNRFTLMKGRPNYVPARLAKNRVVVDPDWKRYFEGRFDPGGNHKLDDAGMPDQLFRNDGANSSGQIQFSNVTKDAGISGRTFGLSTIWFDYNHDTLPDIYVASDYAVPDQLWRNNGDGTFTDVHANVMPYCSWSSMGSAIADLDGNGFFDLVVADMGGSTHFKSKVNMGVLTPERRKYMVEVWPRQAMRNCMLLDFGVGKFGEAATMAGIAKTDWTWNVKASDFDNDGHVDLFFTNGLSRNFSDSDVPFNDHEKIGRTEWEHYRHLPPAKDTNRAFRNVGDVEFQNTSKSWGLDHLGMSYGGAVADFDLDGDMDIVTTNLEEPVQILINEQEKNHGLLLELKGERVNPRGIGATIIVEAASMKPQHRLIQPSTGLLAYDSTQIHFGLGTNTVASKVTITWPDGTEQVLEDLTSGTLHVIEKQSKEPILAEEETTPLFQEYDAGPIFKHRENSLKDYNDFDEQPMMPIRLSRLGPCLVWGDIDADGDDDLFVGGARLQTGRLHLNLGNGHFRRVRGPWEKHKQSDDMGALWLDADRDGDLDLLVASGGAEWPEGSLPLSDRLYLNEGNAKFTEAQEGSLPKFLKSSGPIAAADYDLDGDLDVFLGSRSVPGKYPTVPNSRLLRNDGTPGKPVFVDVTEDVSAALRTPGMVTGAVWTDLDNNGWPDLALSIDYGPIRVYLNEQGILSEATEESGLGKLLGWWNSVASVDVNGDGFFDLVVGNDGINTQHGKISSKKSVSLFYGDMDGSGSLRVIEAKHSKEQAETLLPVRGRGCSCQNIPSLNDKFTTFRQFAIATLDDIYGDKLEPALKVTANNAESGVWINRSSKGSLQFEWSPFPRIVQIAPVFGITATDFDANGTRDLYLVQNFYSTQPETGLWRGGLSQLLDGNGDGTFNCVPPKQSGLVISDDGKAGTLCDINNDQQPDLVVSQNNGLLKSYVRVSDSDDSAWIPVKVQGQPGNPQSIGTTVTGVYESGTEQVYEIQAGAGYLSQNTTQVFLKRLGLTLVKVKSPGQEEEIYQPKDDRLELVIPSAPAATKVKIDR